jgi:hypothetical protein
VRFGGEVLAVFGDAKAIRHVLQPGLLAVVGGAFPFDGNGSPTFIETGFEVIGGGNCSDTVTNARGSQGGFLEELKLSLSSIE